MAIPEVGQKYWMRPGSKNERDHLRMAFEEVCSFCGLHRDDRSRLGWRRLLIEIIPFNRPLTECCGTPDEPPPGSFAIRILQGSPELNGKERWCFPNYQQLLRLA